MGAAPYRKGQVLHSVFAAALIKASEESQVSIFDIAKTMAKSGGINARSIYYAMLFLYSLDIIEFQEPYLVAKC